MLDKKTLDNGDRERRHSITLSYLTQTTHECRKNFRSFEDQPTVSSWYAIFRHSLPSTHAFWSPFASEAPLHNRWDCNELHLLTFLCSEGSSTTAEISSSGFTPSSNSSKNHCKVFVSGSVIRNQVTTDFASKRTSRLDAVPGSLALSESIQLRGIESRTILECSRGNNASKHHKRDYDCASSFLFGDKHRNSDSASHQHQCRQQWPSLTLQLHVNPVSEEELASKVQDIYATLIEVEQRCLNIDSQVKARLNLELSTDQFKSMVALHSTLVYQHHDFLMATYHPSAGPELLGLAEKYHMPGRM